MATRPARKPLTVSPKSHFPAVLIYEYKSEVRPAEHAASVVLNDTRPIPCASSAESVLPGLKPYHPNHRMRPPVAPMIRSCGFIGAPPSRLNTRPRRGPRTIAPEIGRAH